MMGFALGVVLPEHPVGSRWLWKARAPGEHDVELEVVRVTLRTVKMVAPEGWTITFREKEKALRSPSLIRID